MGIRKSSNLEPMEEDSNNETWIDYISFMLLHNQDEDGEGYYGKDYELWYDEGVGDREVDDLSFFSIPKSNFSRSIGRGGGRPDKDISSATAVVHVTTNFNPPYMIDIWEELKLNQRGSIQYKIDSGVGSHNSVLCYVLTFIMSLVLGEVTPTVISNYYKELLKLFIPDKVDTDTVIRKVS